MRKSVNEMEDLECRYFKFLVKVLGTETGREEM